MVGQIIPCKKHGIICPTISKDTMAGFLKFYPKKNVWRVKKNQNPLEISVEGARSLRPWEGASPMAICQVRKVSLFCHLLSIYVVMLEQFFQPVDILKKISNFSRYSLLSNSLKQRSPTNPVENSVEQEQVCVLCIVA